MTRTHHWASLCLPVISAIGLAAGCQVGLAGETQTVIAHGEALFGDYVLPLLKQHCYECHSHEFEEASGGLVVDSRNGLLTGGDLGPAIVPREPDSSLLVKAVRYRDDSLQMPPDGQLPDRDVEHLVEWIRQGAPDPRKPAATEAATDANEDNPSLWSLQPIRDPEVPNVANEAWPQRDLDWFVLARLEAEGLQPAPDADPFVLLRRMHSVLTGLPPSPRAIARQAA